MHLAFRQVNSNYWPVGGKIQPQETQYNMNRRSFLKTALAGGGAVCAYPRIAHAALPKAKITRIRYYKTPTDAAGRPNTQQPLFNQSTNVVAIETDAGLIGIGE